MRRTLLAGSLLAILAGVVVDHGGHLGAELPRTAVLGLALGAVLGLVRDASPAARMGGFSAGFLAVWLGFALRAGVLPDIPMGRAIAAVVVIALITAVSAASRGRIPLWAGLLGAGTLAGAYETTFSATPTAFTAESWTAATTALFCAAVGFLASVVIAELTAGRSTAETGTQTAASRRLLDLPGQRDAHPADATDAPRPSLTRQNTEN